MNPNVLTTLQLLWFCCAICFGLIGTILGIFNVWLTLSKRLVRLRIAPEFTKCDWEGQDMLTIEIDNLNEFPVTIREVHVRREHGPSIELHSEDIRNEQLPHRLQARESVMFILTEDAINQLTHSHANYKDILIITACGVRRYGTSPFFKIFGKKKNRTSPK